MFNFVKFFTLGVLWDAILALDIIFTSNKQPFGASMTTLVLTIISFKMYQRIVGDGKLNWLELIALAVGSSTGTYFTVVYL